MLQSGAVAGKYSDSLEFADKQAQIQDQEQRSVYAALESWCLSRRPGITFYGQYPVSAASAEPVSVPEIRFLPAISGRFMVTDGHRRFSTCRAAVNAAD